ncbi:MAG: acyloxyacyl hydrolase [Gemmatimonadota bacterium]|nr:acyloxyacyl hydrolase [Gemmatimonadota bacterium]
MRHSHRWPKLIPIALAALSALPGVASSQSAAADSSATRIAKTEQPHHPLLIAVIGGSGVETPTPYLFESNGNIYQTQKRPMVFEVEVSKTLFATSGRDNFFEYFVAAQPVISIGGNVRYRFLPCLRMECFRQGVDINEQRYTSYGVGVTPFGARMTTTLPHRTRLSLSLGVGTVVLNHAIPYDQAKRVNFQLSARPALGVPVGNHGTLWAGYELFHMSNANTSPINPGINAGLVMFGYQRER